MAVLRLPHTKRFQDHRGRERREIRRRRYAESRTGYRPHHPASLQERTARHQGQPHYGRRQKLLDCIEGESREKTLGFYAIRSYHVFYIH